MKFSPFVCGVLLIYFSAVTRAQTTGEFIGPGGGDLADPSNWSGNVVPEVGIVNQDGPLNFTLSEDLTGLVLEFDSTGDFQSSIDLMGHQWTDGGIETVPGTSGHYTVSNGRILGFQSSYTQALQKSISFDNVTMQEPTSPGIVVYGRDQASLLLDDQSVVRLRRVFSDQEAAVRVQGNSRLIGNTRLGRSDGEIAGEASSSLDVSDSSSLTGYFGLESEGDVEISIRGGVKTVGETRIAMSGSRSRMIIEGEGTDLHLNQLAVLFTSFRNLTDADFSIIEVRDGAQVHFVNDVTSTNPFFVEPEPITNIPAISEGDYHIFHTLVVSGEGTLLEGTLSPIDAVHIQVTDGAVLRNSQQSSAVGSVLVRDATIEGKIVNKIGPSVSSTLFNPAGNDFVVDHGQVVGDIEGFATLTLSAGMIVGDVSVYNVDGNGTIDGNVQRLGYGRSTIAIRPDGLLNILGDVGRISLLETDILGLTPEIDFDVLRIGGEFLELTKVTDVSEISQIGDGFFERWDIHFSPYFRASVGDRLTLLEVLGMDMSIEQIIDEVLQLIPPENHELARKSLTGLALNKPNILNLPEGYEVDFFIEPHAVGIEITAVPEVGVLTLLAIGMSFAIGGSVLRGRRVGQVAP